MSLYSQEEAIHNKLQAERDRQKQYLCVGRSGGKQNAVYKIFQKVLSDPSIYAVRRDVIPKKELNTEALKKTIDDLERAREIYEAKQKLREYLDETCEQWVRRYTEKELNTVWITTANPYWEPIIRPDAYMWDAKYMCEWPNSYKWGVISDVFRESNSTQEREPQTVPRKQEL